MAKTMAELERKLSEKKSLGTGDIVDKLAPHGIYGTKDDGHKSLKLREIQSVWLEYCLKRKFGSHLILQYM